MACSLRKEVASSENIPNGHPDVQLHLPEDTEVDETISNGQPSVPYEPNSPLLSEEILDLSPKHNMNKFMDVCKYLEDGIASGNPQIIKLVKDCSNSIDLATNKFDNLSDTVASNYNGSSNWPPIGVQSSEGEWSSNQWNECIEILSSILSVFFLFFCCLLSHLRF